MKNKLLFFGLLMLVVPMKAQDFEDYKRQRQAEMERYKDSVRQNYDEYRRRANEEYAQYMRENWEAFNALKGDPKPEIPEPPRPFEFDKDKPIPNLPNPIPFKPIATPKPSPVQPVKRPDIPKPSPVPSVSKFEFVCYGTTCSVSLDKSLKFKLKKVEENAVADAWLHLSSEKSDALVGDCFDLRDELQLGDWAYYCLLRDLSDQFLGKNTDESTLMLVYLLAQSGYKVRIGYRNGHLVALVPFDGIVYECSQIRFKGTRYYIMGQKEGGTTNMFNKVFSDNERVMSLRMPCTPKFAYKPTSSRTFTSKRYPELTVTLSTNKNLIDFYDGYPSCEWTYYSWAGLSDQVKAKLYPMLRKGIEGKSQIEAANRIINFVQTALEYQTDQDQFGYERPLFGDETFFYPFCDCEDRSILFSTLIHDLLGLDVVLLLYPGHMATAVAYTEPLNGCYFEYQGKTFYISDPTYIGANVGECAPKFIKMSPEVYKL